MFDPSKLSDPAYLKEKGGWGSIYLVFPIKGKMEPDIEFQCHPPPPIPC